jgi:hypothetical protein
MVQLKGKTSFWLEKSHIEAGKMARFLEPYGSE